MHGKNALCPKSWGNWRGRLTKNEKIALHVAGGASHCAILLVATLRATKNNAMQVAAASEVTPVYSIPVFS